MSKRGATGQITKNAPWTPLKLFPETCQSSHETMEIEDIRTWLVCFLKFTEPWPVLVYNSSIKRIWPVSVQLLSRKECGLENKLKSHINWIPKTQFSSQPNSAQKLKSSTTNGQDTRVCVYNRFVSVSSLFGLPFYFSGCLIPFEGHFTFTLPGTKSKTRILWRVPFYF